jgi:maltooligosyltrehalose trehalohydrolase
VVELMPVAEFSGRFGWGYDGVDPFAPTHLYGAPDDLRSFVDRAHALGIAVILDVVYNHLGPDGCYLGAFSRDYFTDRYENEWGDAINFDGENSGPVREFFAENAAYWVREFHMDGLRLDATQQIFDNSPEHILAVISRRVREAAGSRAAVLIGENEPQEIRMVEPLDRGGHGLDALWNDDFHHSTVVALTGRREAYYTDYLGSPQELISVARWGFLYQGQWYRWQGKRRGTPALDACPTGFVNYLQNHDQVANSAAGARLHLLTSPGRYRAITAYLLLGPGTPMLFQGQEFGASSPFLYFADHRGELGESVRRGRAEFLRQFPSIATAEVRERLADPSDPETFRRCKLNLTERQTRSETYSLHRDLLRLRREDSVFARPRRGGVDGAVLGPEAFVLRYFGEADGDRLLIVNLGGDLELGVLPEPLLAPPAQGGWQLLWASESPRYGGNGAGAVESGEAWRIPSHAALVLTSMPDRIGNSTSGLNGRPGRSPSTGESVDG